MEKLISTTFKILAGSMIFAMCLDMGLYLFEISSAHSKVSNISYTLQSEISKNNYLPEAFVDDYLDPYLKTIVDTSTSISGITYDLGEVLGEGAAGVYGDVKDFTITVDSDVSLIMFPITGDGNTSTTPEEKAWEVEMKYTYSVPCLRYLK